jgi:uncharacterized membrane protein YvbJ
MRCPKCGEENLEAVRFCRRCHTPLRYTCPACGHVQSTGGNCEKCGVDFAKYAVMLQLQMKNHAEQERERVKNRSSIIKQILLLPVTGGLSLLKYVRMRLRGDD